jgi:hypothetical protein
MNKLNQLWFGYEVSPSKGTYIEGLVPYISSVQKVEFWESDWSMRALPSIG